MESLPRWGIANSDPRNANQPLPRSRTDLDPAIDAILGKPDAELMKEALDVAVDEKRGEDERIQALEDFEMLIEQIDNANNLEKLKMWETLHSLLTKSTSSEEIQMKTLQILGTAVQNNPAAQNSYLALSPFPELFLGVFFPSLYSGKTRSRAVYALSGLLKHNAAAVQQMHDVGGWKFLRDALQDSDITVRRKVAFLLNTLLIPTEPSSSQSQSMPQQQPLQVPTSTTTVPATVDQSSSASTSSSASASIPSPASPQLESDASLSPPQTVHPNSHASMVADPSSYSTSPLTIQALEQHGLLSTLVSSLTQPVPHGPNGELVGDADFEGKVLRALHTYTVGCGRPIAGEDRKKLGEWLEKQSANKGGDGEIAELWGLTEIEVRDLRQAVA